MSASPALLADLFQQIGSDLVASNTGDLLTVTGTARGKQRVLRRLFTNAGDYLFEPTYGAGLPQMMGKPIDVPKTQALILSQMLLEDAVAKTPAPVVIVTQSPNDFTAFKVDVNYTDQPSSEPVILSFSVP